MYKWLTIVLCFSLFSCAQESPSPQVIETKTMATRYYDSLSKVLTVTSASDQVLKNISFPPRYYNPFKVTDMTVNGKRLVDWTKEEGRNFDSHDIQYPLKKGDELQITIDFRPADPKDDPYKAPNAGEFYEHELLLLFEGERVSQIYFVLRGIARGTCEDCQPQISGERFEFAVRTLTVESNGGSLEDEEMVPETVPVNNPIVFYLDKAEKKAFLRGEDIPTFKIMTALKPGGTEVPITIFGESGAVYAGIYGEDGSIDFKDPAGIIINVSSDDLNGYTQLTTGSVSIPDDYWDMDPYKELNPTLINGIYAGEGSKFDEALGTMSMVGGIIAVGGNYQRLKNGVVGIKFDLELTE